MTHYDTLQVSRTASAEVIESAWRALLRVHHPDLPDGDEAYARQAKSLRSIAETTSGSPDARR